VCAIALRAERGQERLGRLNTRFAGAQVDNHGGGRRSFRVATARRCDYDGQRPVHIAAHGAAAAKAVADMQWGVAMKTLARALLLSLAILPASLGAQVPDASRPIAARGTVWIDQMTWMEIRDAIATGKTTAIIPTGGNEQNGPYSVTGKHSFIVKADAEAIAERLGNALITPVFWFEPGGNPEAAGEMGGRTDQSPPRPRVRPREECLEERIASGLTTINGISIVPPIRTIENGGRMKEMKVLATVQAIQKAVRSRTADR
jgi:hypothetical protein